MNKMIRGGVRFGPATGVRYDPAQIAVLEARLRLAEEVCDAAAARLELDWATIYHRHDDGTVTVEGGWPEWIRTVEAVGTLTEALARWREAKR
jgi:hypothetical protein